LKGAVWYADCFLPAVGKQAGVILQMSIVSNSKRLCSKWHFAVRQFSKTLKVSQSFPSPLITRRKAGKQPPSGGTHPLPLAGWAFSPTIGANSNRLRSGARALRVQKKLL